MPVCDRSRSLSSLAAHAPGQPLTRFPRPWLSGAVALALGLMAAAAAQAQQAGGGGGGQGQGQGPGPVAPVTPVRPGPPADAPQGDGGPTDTGVQHVEVVAAPVSEVSERRQSTAAKIIIGREDIERYGDTTVGEIMKRLPGISVQGAPGRGGNVRMRGLGNGYTQILIDGERVPPGFSLDSLAPEQIERIEILKAPTAETGGRAIGGTINVITRDGYRKRLNDLRLGLGIESGRLQPNASWTRNDSSGDLVWTASASLFASDRESDSTVLTTDTPDAGGPLTLEQTEVFHGTDTRRGLHTTGRLQWKFGGGDSLVVSPMLVMSNGHSDRQSVLDQSVGDTPPAYTASDSRGASRFAMGRASLQGNHAAGNGARVELKASANLSQSSSHTLRTETGTADGVPDLWDDRARARDSGNSLGLKYSLLVADEHGLVLGVETENNRHIESHHSLENGVAQLTDFGDNLTAGVARWAAYGQDEWNPSPKLALSAGLRLESIATDSRDDNGHDLSNHSSVWTPMLHGVWKPEPKSNDQVRLSLTRSYRSPTLQNLVARPSLSRGDNTATQPDRAGNPALQPELASGVDLAFEHYLANTGGMFSAGVFVRQIHQLIRSLTTLETVSWDSVQRWVSRPQNVGDATTHGLELEARFRLSDLVPDAPKIDWRANASIYRSQVEGVAGPDNRLDQQPGYTLNLGADYKIPATPLTVGGNINYTPGYLTQVSTEAELAQPGQLSQVAVQGSKRVLDAYVAWAVQPGTNLRLSASNLGPRDYVTGSLVDANGSTENATTLARTTVNWQVRLEMKL